MYCIMLSATGTAMLLAPTNEHKEHVKLLFWDLLLFLFRNGPNVGDGRLPSSVSVVGSIPNDESVQTG